MSKINLATSIIIKAPIIDTSLPQYLPNGKYKQVNQLYNVSSQEYIHVNKGSTFYTLQLQKSSPQLLTTRKYTHKP